MGKKRKLAQGGGGGGRAHQPPKRIKANGSGAGSSSNSNSRKPNSAGPTKPQKQKQKQDTSGKPPQQQRQQQHLEPTIPFSPEDKILLVGDGDLSFAASLVEHHYCADVTATVFEKSCEELLEKYPHAGENIAKIDAEEGCRVIFGVDATKMAPSTNKVPRNKSQASDRDNEDRDRGGKPKTAAPGIMDRIFFNFPHVGGKSTDVNRQVRYNQELLVSFFQRAMPSLAPGGSIIVTLFEGEPYTLWNVRDLARHSGLQVERSFRFQASAYPGYHHARTLGVVRNRDGEVGGGWKGEDRAARSYVFVQKKDAARPSVSHNATRQSRKRKNESSDDNDDDN
ncbi:hypothetical protein F5Y16DRAFT_16212 [Xylariaceae sp. FL0255]|nr:hypothetical protein F5Y16DRAFT_16212 [Xylariaceae sp. FL0255]